MNQLRLSVSCGDYDYTHFLVHENVHTPGLQLTVIPLPSAERHQRFTRNLEFDVCELQIGVYLGSKSRGMPVTAIPVYPHRRFCHGSVIIHPKAGIHQPGDFAGKRVGIQAHFNPVALWMRGVLQHGYGVSPDSICWVTNADEQVKDWNPPCWLRIERPPKGKNVGAMLDDGELDATMLPSLSKSFLMGESPGKRLWPNYRQVELGYYRKTGIYPIRHVVVIKDEILQRDPWVAVSVQRAFEDAKRLGIEHRRDPRRSFLAWYSAQLEDEQQIFGPDPCPYNVKDNVATLEAMLDYAAEQAITDRRLKIEEIFFPTTLPM